jgi:hypothetical protein
MTEDELKAKRLEFLNETISFYTSENRCIDDNGNCKYYFEGKPGCAIGRHIEDKELCKNLDSNLPDTFFGGASVSYDYIFNELPAHLKILGKEFLHMVQQLHDNADNWDINGITIHGDKSINEIKRKFNL